MEIDFTKPLIVGLPAVDFPTVFGYISLSKKCVERNRLGEWQIGKHLVIQDVLFMMNVSYIQNNPKRERLMPVLQPLSKISDEWWAKYGEKVKNVEIKKEEEYPF